MILVNHFLHNFWLDLPVLLGEFFAGLLDGMHTFVKHTCQSGKAHGGNHQTKNSTKYEITHTISLENAHTVELSGAVSVSLDSTIDCAFGTYTQLLAVCKKHSMIVWGDRSGIPGIPLQTVV